jgi:hypothetical protein
MQNIQISIPSPCHEDWAQMTPEERGRFCSVCSKTVMDFTKQTEEEIERFIEEHRNEKLCGRFLKTQLQPIIQVPIQSLRRKLSPLQAFVMAAMIAFGSSLISCTTEKGQIVGDIVLSSSKENYRGTTFGEPIFLSAEDTVVNECSTLTGDVDIIGKISTDESHIKGEIAIDDTMQGPELDPIIISDNQVRDFQTMGLMVIDIKNPMITEVLDTSSNKVLLNNPEETPVTKFSFQLFPNPSNGAAHIKFEIPKQDNVVVELFDITGRMIERLFEFKNAKADNYDLFFTINQPPGIYLVSIQYGDKRESQRLVIDDTR